MPLEAQANANEGTTAASATPSSADAFSTALASSQQASGSADGAQSQVADGQQNQLGAAAASPSWSDVAKQHGFQVDQYKSQEDFYKALAAERQQQAPLVKMAQHVAPHFQQFSSWMQQQQAQAAQQAQQPAQQQAKPDPNAWHKEHFGKAWKVPSFDQSWQQAISQGLLVLGDDGRYQPAPGAELMVANMVAPANAFREAQADAMQQLFLQGNPFEQFYEVAKPAFMRDMETMVREMMGQQQQEVTQLTALDQWEQTNESALYTQDTTGQRVFTPEGQKLVAEAQTLREKYPSMDHVEALEIASLRTGFHQYAAGIKAEAAKTPAQKSQAQIGAFIDRAKSNSSPGATANHFNQNTPQAPVTVDQGELDNFWVQEFRRQQATGA